MYNYCITYRAPNTIGNALMNIRAASKEEAKLIFRNAYLDYQIIDVI